MQHFFKRPACTSFFRHHACAGASWLLLVACTSVAPAALLLEEGFNYPVGSNLTANSPWIGSGGASLSVASNNLMQPNLRDTVPAGNLLRVGGGGSRTAYRNFASTAVTNGAVYFSALIQCTLRPTNSQPLAFFQTSGSTDFTASDNPMSLYIVNANNGYCFRIAEHGEQSALTKTLTTNTTHLIVVKYQFRAGTQDRVSLFLDPTPGGSEPTTPDAAISDIPFSNLRSLGFYAPSLASQGSWNLDTLRVGTAWADVTPLPNVLTLTGPSSLAACAGTPATFSVAVVGTPPFTYRWRANGALIPDATNSSYTLANPTAADAATGFDVIVTDTFNSKTSSVAGLSVSTTAPQIISAPTDQTFSPGVSATFTVGVTGSAPLTIQWRTNGTPIPDATNNTYTLIAPTAADTLNGYDVVVANPCGTVTSSPPVFGAFPHEFYSCDALPGFFGGMNLIAIQPSGMSVFFWSSTDPTLPVTRWNLEAPADEQPLNDGTGRSYYSITANPFDPLVYYLIGTTTAGPYVPTVPLNWITTDSFGGNTFFTANYFINANGVLQLPTPPSLIQSPLAQTAMVGQPVQFTVAATGTEPLRYQWFFNDVAVPAATNAALRLSGLGNSNAGNFTVVVTNDFGAVTSSIAALTILPTPRLAIQKVPTGIKLTSGAAVPGDVYRLLATTNLQPPVNWEMLTSGLVATNGLVQFTDNTTTTRPQLYYRLALPSAFPTAPSITQPPASRTVLAGQVFSFTAVATGSEPLSYQWYFNTNTLLANGASANLTLTGGAPGSAGNYFLIVTNYSGSVTSSLAALTVLPALRLTAQLTASGFQLSGFGVPGDTYRVQGTTSLVPPVAWLTLTTKIAAMNGLLQFSDTNLSSHPSYFYRLISP